jgi:hypothetical protein
MDMAQVSNAQIADEIKELKARFIEHDKIEREFQAQYWMRHSEVKQSAEASHRRIDKIEVAQAEMHRDYKQLASQIAPLIQAYKILAFLGGAIGLSIIALIWSLITGSVIIATP